MQRDLFEVLDRFDLGFVMPTYVLIEARLVRQDKDCFHSRPHVDS